MIPKRGAPPPEQSEEGELFSKTFSYANKPTKFRIRAHTEESGPHRWAYLADLSPMAWTLDPQKAQVQEGLYDFENGSYIPNPTKDDFRKVTTVIQNIVGLSALCVEIELLN